MAQTGIVKATHSIPGTSIKGTRSRNASNNFLYLKRDSHLFYSIIFKITKFEAFHIATKKIDNIIILVWFILLDWNVCPGKLADKNKAS